MPGALILDHGLSRSALAGARSLARSGWTVGIGSPAPSLASASRAASAYHHVPPPESGLDAFVAAVNAATAAGGYDIVLGSDDQHMLALSERRDDVDAAIGYPGHERVVAAVDKQTLVEAGARVGVAVPRTEEATEAALDRLGVPVVVKARVHASFEGEHSHAHLDPVLAGTREAALERAAAMRAEAGAPVFQQAIAGDLVAYALVADRDSQVVVSVQQETQRLWPPAAGVSTLARTVPEDPELAAGCARLVSELGWTGIAQFQFLRPPGGSPHLIDFNGRFYGSLALAVAAGADLPGAWAAVACGQPPPARRSARPDVRYQWFEGDLRRALREREGGLLRDAGRTLAAAPRATHSVFDATDPQPALRYLGLFARRAIGRVRG